MTTNSKTLRPELQYFGSFTSSFRIKVHTLINWGYRGALSRIKHNSHEETTITGYICEAINKRLRAFDCPIKKKLACPQESIYYSGTVCHLRQSLLTESAPLAAEKKIGLSPSVSTIINT